MLFLVCFTYLVRLSFGDWAYPDDLNLRNRPSNYHSHHYHHTPEFHSPEFHNQMYYHGPERSSEGKEPGTPEDYGGGRRSKNSSLQIPVDYVRQLNSFNVTDLLLNYVDGDVDDASDGFILLTDRFNGGDSQERSASAVMPKEAGCIPELTTVKIAYSDDPSVLYIPQCTRIERCGGCCSHTLLSCQPQDKDIVSFKVLKTQYTGAKKLKLVGKEIVTVEKHTKCRCDCRIQPEDCNRFQEYRKSECRCACTNTDEEKKCYKSNNQTKLWNPEICACQCREVMPCSTGYTFDSNECRCVASTLRRRYAVYGRKTKSEEQQPSSPVAALFNSDSESDN